MKCFMTNQILSLSLSCTHTHIHKHMNFNENQQQVYWALVTVHMSFAGQEKTALLRCFIKIGFKVNQRIEE